MAIKTIAFLYPGAMGASLARVLHKRQSHLQLLTHLSGRSESTLKRAREAGLSDVPLRELVERSDLIISILPPSEAVILSRQIVSHLPASSSSRTSPIYLDANAISPGTVDEIASILEPHNIPFIDGSVIGGPAKDDLSYLPKLYLSSSPKWEKQLQEVVETLRGAEEGKGLFVEVLDGAGQGAASALKMCYGGITKGTTGLATLLVLAANAHSPATADALLRELSISQTSRLQGLTGTIPAMIHKAYRWVGEMEEIASFVSASLLQTTPKSDQADVADTYRGIAQVYQRIADDLERNQKLNAQGGSEVDVLKNWTDKGKQVLGDAKKA